MPQQKDPLHIAFATPEYVTEDDFDGGLANYLDRATRYLKARGHRPEIFVLSERDERFDIDGVTVVRVARRPRFARLYQLRCRSRFSEALESYLLRRALMSAHSFDPLDLIQYSSYRSTGLYRFGVPSVVRISSYTPLWRRAYGRSASRRDHRRDRLEIEALRRADAVFGPGDRLARAVRKDCGIPVHLIETPFELYKGPRDSSRFESCPASQGRYLLYFGTLGRLKGVLTIASMLRELLARHSHLSFVFIGKDLGHEGRAIVDSLEEAAGPHAERIHYYPKMRHSQLYPFIRAAAGVVLPSLIDNFPNVCLEAMSQARVVIGTLGSSFEQLIEDGKSGFLVEPDDSRALLRQCDRLLGMSDEKTRSMGHAALSRIRLLRPQITVAKLESFYRETIATYQENALHPRGPLGAPGAGSTDGLENTAEGHPRSRLEEPSLTALPPGKFHRRLRVPV
jgi:glycosyltransferase involved in cell wall biosynthesis